MSLKLGVLISGSGTNLQAIIDAIAQQELDAEIKLVVCNKAAAAGIDRAKKAQLPVTLIEHKQFSSRPAFDEELVRQLRAAGVEWIALAGFMRVLTPTFLEAFSGKIINIHPSLLPAFPGVNAQEQAYEYGVKVAGCTTHFVDGGVDTGPIIAQRSVPVLNTDNADDLKARILKEEHLLFVQTLQAVAEGRVQLQQQQGRPKVMISPSSSPSTSKQKLPPLQ